MQYGLENEYFVIRDGLPVMVDSKVFPYDECGYLVEARGKPASSIREAVYSLLAEEDRLAEIAISNGYVLVKKPVMKIPQKVMLQIRRTYSKGLTTYENYLGYDKHPTSLAHAGMHLSITNPINIPISDRSETIVYKMFDFIKVFRVLDQAFKEEIKDAKRRPGFYELKNGGRIEYRSLPNTADVHKLIRVIENIKGV